MSNVMFHIERHAGGGGGGGGVYVSVLVSQAYVQIPGTALPMLEDR